jgi:hypothetical protein
MKYYEAVLVVIAIIILGLWVTGNIRFTEGYAPCKGDCSQAPLPPAGIVRLNPFEWPYSAWANPDTPYMSPSAAMRVAPLTHLTTPDHTVLTN